MTETRPQLTISLLISNRIETIPRCLDSLRPILDAIPCELILTDTSKNPEVHDLLLKYTDQVYEFEWCNDFAKARNLGLQKATGEWFMFLDDDEWFADTSGLIDFFKSGEYQKYYFANYQVRNFKDSEYIYYEDCWLARLFRIEKDSRFVRKIHEQYAPLKGEGKRLPALVYHSGYIYKTLEDRRKHFERNQKLLQDMLKEEPDDIYWWLQLTQEYSYAGEQEKLIAYSKECLEKLFHIDTPYVNNQRAAFYTGLVSGCIRQKRYEECIEYAEKALADERSGKVLNAMMHLRLAEGYLFLNRIDDAKEAVSKYLNITETIDLKAPEIIEQLEVFLAGEAFSKNSYEIAYAIQICCDLKRGNTVSLKEHYDKLNWSQPVVYTMERIEKFLVEAMTDMPYEPIFARVIIDAFNKDNLREAFRREILSCRQEDVTPFQQLIYNIASTMQNIIDGPKEDVLDYYAVLKKYVQVVSEWYDFIELQGLLGYLRKEAPAYIQAAINISDYLEIETQDKIAALGRLKNAVDNLPEFAKGIGRFFERYKELESQRAIQQSNEMEALRVQVIAQVKEMIEGGQKKEAMQILGQLKAMFPEDEEIKNIQEKVF